jgi:hypothetical protein
VQLLADLNRVSVRPVNQQAIDFQHYLPRGDRLQSERMESPVALRDPDARGPGRPRGARCCRRLNFTRQVWIHAIPYC